MEIDPKRSLSQDQFCWLENISKAKFYQLKKRGLAPTVTNIDGLLRISPESREAWHERMAERAKSEAARLEAERRHELAVSAGRAASRSPKHVSKKTAKTAAPRPRWPIQRTPRPALSQRSAKAMDTVSAPVRDRA